MKMQKVKQAPLAGAGAAYASSETANLACLAAAALSPFEPCTNLYRMFSLVSTDSCVYMWLSMRWGMLKLR